MNRAHLVHALSFWFLVASGILLLPAPFAEIRQLLVGGHGLQVKRVHLWLSLPFIAGFAGFWGRRGQWAPSRLAFLPVWRTGHVWISLVLTVVLAGSGVVLWGKPSWPEPWMEGVRSVHVELTWIACAWGFSHAVVDGVRWLRWRGNTPSAVLRESCTGNGWRSRHLRTDVCESKHRSDRPASSGNSRMSCSTRD